LIENAVIFSKANQEVLLASTFGDIQHDSEDFKNSLEEIRKTATKLEKGIFILDIEHGFTALILAISELSIALVFNKSLDKKEKNEWENVAKEIIDEFAKHYDSRKQDAQYSQYEKSMKEIVDWYLKEKSPLDKMKDALW